MNSKNVVIGVLVIAVLILCWMWLDARNDMKNVLANLESETRDYQAEIKEKCGENATPAQIEANEECQEALEDLAEALEDYQVKLDDAEAEAETEASTSN